MIYLSFEEVPVWQESRVFQKDIHDLINKYPKLRGDFALSNQLKRASYSIILNIAEGFERSSNTEFANFLNIAKGSAGEVRSILYIIEDVGHAPSEEIQTIINKVRIISAHLANFRTFLLQRKSRKK